MMADKEIPMRLSLFCALLSLMALPLQASECETAAAQYDDAVSRVGTALGGYHTCIEASQGQQNCADDFKTLDAAQEAYEKAVDSVKSACGK